MAFITSDALTSLAFPSLFLIMNFISAMTLTTTNNERDGNGKQSEWENNTQTVLNKITYNDV